MWIQALKRSLLGQPIPTALERHERLDRATGLAVFASDPLSSVAYATEEIFLGLILAGTGALHTSVPISLGIALLLAIVVSSYRQTILAYPTAGGAYIVSRENLGTYPSLVAGAALLTDYVLTVSVSVAAGIAAVTSAFPPLYPHRVELGVLAIVGMTLANLRGVRESGRLFAIPTYAFVASYFLMIGWGAVVWLLGGGTPTGAAPAGIVTPGTQELTLFLVLRAAASGCVALTGVEAVSNGVPAFRPPEARNARQVMAMLGVIAITLFVGITVLANAFGLLPAAQETINSQLARRVFGDGSLLYYFVQAMTMLILVLAANTSFADFPRLSSFMARDRFMPRQFANRGDRLAFSNGIIILAVLSALLVVLFNAETHALIPLYAVGVFISFTLSQLGMVRYWLRERGARWVTRALLNGVGGIATAVVTLVVATVKFAYGAWIVILLIPSLVVVFLVIRRHYDDVARQLSLDEAGSCEPPLPFHLVLVPVGDVHRGVLDALRYAKTISTSTRGVYIETEPEARRRVEERKGRRRKHPRRGFVEQRLQIEGREVRYTLSERPVRLRAGLRLREIAELRDDGEQTIFVTSHFEHPGVLLAYRMFERWRQENYFRYMKENFALDALVDYGVEADDPQREVPNPARKRLEATLREARTGLAELERTYGAAAAANAEAQRRTMRGFKVAHGQVGRALRAARARVATLTAQRAPIPKRVPIGQVLGREQVVRLTLERKLFTDAIKAAAYRAESVLLRLLRPHFTRADDEGRAFLRAALHQPADLVVEGKQLRVRVAPMSAPRFTAALRALCDELNAREPHFPETPYRLRYEVADPPEAG